MSDLEREEMAYDVVIVGAGPAGLASAIRLKQLAQDEGHDVSVAVLEKAGELGGHSLSGAILDPRALEELLPAWRNLAPPNYTAVEQDQFWFLSAEKHWNTPGRLLPDCFKNHGNMIISLSEWVRWLGQQAEQMGVDIFPGFAASNIIFDASQQHVIGVYTHDVGRTKQGEAGPGFQPGMALYARYTLLAEGARGHLGKQLIQKFNLDQGHDPQVYGIGLKEVWRVPKTQHQPGLAIHSAGWPLANDTYGGSFIYHYGEQLISLGMVVGLNYQNPSLSPFDELQRLKTHPSIQAMLRDGERLAYGARAITAGGLMSLPKMIFPGGALLGCDAGFLNAARIKGNHAAMKSGMLAAEAAFSAIREGRQHDELADYPKLFTQSWLFRELYRARNFKQWMSKGLWLGSFMVGIEQRVLRGHVPWTLHHQSADHQKLKPLSDVDVINYPKPDGVLTFDRLSSVALTGVNHRDDQPCHLTLRDANIPIAVNLPRYGGPEQYYCPAGVYEYLSDSTGQQRLQINAQNCIHCKTCDIKDPTQNINWVNPEGGDGPNYRLT